MAKLDPHLIIVNKNKPFDKSMLSAFEMVPVVDSDGKTYMEEYTYYAFGELCEYLEQKHGITLELTSAGRTIETQQKVLDEMIALNGESAKATTALPGQSEHHTGLALDVIPSSAELKKVQKWIGNISTKLAQKVVRPIKDDLYQTLHESLEQFGFILRYTKDKQHITGYPAERWHIRYVGKEHAKSMNQNNLCLEEYVEFLKSNQNDLS